MKKKKWLWCSLAVAGITVGNLGLSYLASYNDSHITYDKISKSDEMVAVYLDDGSGNYNKASDGKIPVSGYTLNTDANKTKCSVNGEVDSGVSITYENGEVKVSKVTKPGTKCNFYFDKIKDTTNPVIGVHEARNIEKTSMDLYVEATDDMGIAGYYFKLSTSDDWGEADCVNKTYCLHSVTGLTADTNYTFDVKACDASGNCSTTTITQQTKPSGTPIPAGTTSSTLLNYSIKPLLPHFKTLLKMYINNMVIIYF